MERVEVEQHVVLHVQFLTVEYVPAAARAQTSSCDVIWFKFATVWV